MRDEAAVIGEQLGRPPRGLRGVAHRCPCGQPDVVETAPRLDDGTPFPTLFYLTCPRATAAVSRLESGGLMRDMQQRLADDPDLRAAQQAAHRDYVGRRAAAAAAAGVEPLPSGTQSAGGMPDRVKCLHALVAHELAVPGANPLGREAAEAAGAVVGAGPVRPVSLPGKPARVAAIDCGTNSLRLLVADVDPGAGRLTDVDRRMQIVRLGQGVDSTGRLAPEALQRTLGALRGYARIIGDLSAEAVRMVATSATRDAANAADFVQGVTSVLGIEPEVLSGTDEAYLSFSGATAEFGASPEPPGPPYLVVDIGGGSTEFVVGDGQAARDSGAAGVSAVSVDIGCVRLTERHLRSDPPRPAEIRAAAADIDAALDVVAGAIPVTGARTLVGLAGSVTTVAALALGLAEYDSARIHHTRIPVDQVTAQMRRLLGQTREERAALGVMHPGRADVIAGGVMVLERIMRRFGFGEVLASEHDILDGIAWVDWPAGGDAGDLPEPAAAGGNPPPRGPAGPRTRRRRTPRWRTIRRRSGPSRRERAPWPS